MKKVKLSDYSTEGEWFLIEKMEDLFLYATQLKNKVENHTRRLVVSQSTIDRWDHLLTNTEEGAILSASVIKSSLLGNSPLKELDVLFSTKIKNMLKELKNGKKILVNCLGGYCAIKDENLVIVKEESFPVLVKSYEVKKNTKYINIENDDQLEKETEKYLSEKDVNFSYILNLHTFNHEEILNIFKEFKQQGGEILYVCTTGIDIPQMRTYINAANLADIKKIELKFKNSVNEQHKKLFEIFNKENINFINL